MQHICKIIDTTLREGEQTPGVLFSCDTKKRIINDLAAINVAEIELGVASPLAGCLPEIVKFCQTNHPQLQTSLWSRCKTEDVLYAATLGVNILSISLPASDLHLGKKLKKDRDWAVRNLKNAIATAKELGQKVAVGFEDATRAEPRFLDYLCQTASKAGAVRIRIADTIGTTTPTAFGELIQRLSQLIPGCEMAVHTHNDFGMATANAVAALENGAHWADATVLGLGERCGCARLEELIGYLQLVAGQDSYRLEPMKTLSHYLAQQCGQQIDVRRPLLGEKIFACESGLHLQGIQSDPATYEPYDPAKIGATREMLYGAKSGRAALAQHLRGLGYDSAKNNILPLLRNIRQEGQARKRPLTELELRHLLTSETQIA